MQTFAPYLAAFAVVGIIYGSLACLALARHGASGDLKRLIAYSSVGHMGFVLLGIATHDPHRRQRRALRQHRPRPDHRPAVLPGRRPQGPLRHRRPRHPRRRHRRRPLRPRPRLGGLLAFAAVASLGLPGLAGFWGEMLALFGAFDPAEGLSRPRLPHLHGASPRFGTLLTAAYLLVVVRRVCMGDARPAATRAAARSWPTSAATNSPPGPRSPPSPSSPDCGPRVLLGLTDPAVQQLLAGGKS